MKIGITIGDLNGVGPEVIIKALAHPKLLNSITPVIYGSYKVMAYHKNIVKESNIQFHSIQSAKQAVENKVNLVNCWDDNITITLGKATSEGGKYAAKSLEKALEDIKEGSIDAIVTAPINKSAMKMSDFPFAGHTEYFSAKDDHQTSLMFLVSDAIKVALVTNHLPISEVARNISKDLIIQKIKLLNQSLIVDFGLERPVISVLGLNPHASDDSTIGDEEETLIKPAIIECKKQGIMVSGPYAADGFFGSGLWKKTDAVLAMYHDQGLIPFKTLSFGSGTNITAGLSFVRTSPDHGTAYDIVGQNLANESSMLKAIFYAADIAKARQNYVSDRENSIIKRERQSAGIND